MTTFPPETQTPYLETNQTPYLETNQTPYLELGIATIRAISCRSEIATRQFLQDIASLDPKKASKFIQKIYDLLEIQDQQWLKSVICPGLS